MTKWKKTNTRAHAHADTSLWDLRLPWRTQTLTLRRKPHHGAELSTQHWTASRCLANKIQVQKVAAPERTPN